MAYNYDRRIASAGALKDLGKHDRRASSGEAQKAFQHEIHRSLSDALRQALNEEIGPIYEQLADFRRGEKPAPYQLIRYKPNDMTDEEFFRSVETFVVAWSRNVAAAIAKV